jgi:hypothetical protein
MTRNKMEIMTVQVLLTELETARESLDRAFACLATPPRSLNNEPRISVNPVPRNPTIKFVTENGFAIERVCEGGSFTTDSASECHFVVYGSKGEERWVTVAFAEAAIRRIQSLRLIPLPANSPFWLRCAERHLATYLWEMNNYPPAGSLRIDQLSDENLRLAMRAE